MCHATAHASATRAIAAQEGAGWRLATQEDVETHGAALAQLDPAAAVSSFALAAGRIARAVRPRGPGGSAYFCSASSPDCDGLPRLLVRERGAALAALMHASLPPRTPPASALALLLKLLHEAPPRTLTPSQAQARTPNPKPEPQP